MAAPSAKRRRPAQGAFPVSLRLRLTLWYSAVLTIVLGLFGAAVYTILVFSLTSQIDQSLEDAANGITASANLARVLDQPIVIIPAPDEPLGALNVSAQVWRLDGTLATQTENLKQRTTPLDPEGLAARKPGRRNVRWGNDYLRVHTYLIRANGEVFGYLQTAASLRTVEAASSALLVVLVGGGALSVLLAALIGWLSAGRALKPLDVITQTALQITRADDLSRRIPIQDPNDEVGRLAVAFNETLERLERLFNAQRRFLADVSHELRTPLTAIRGNVDLLQRLGGADPESLRDIRSETERMTRLVGDLLVLAQADSGHLPLERKPVDLDGLLLEVCREVQVLAGQVHVAVGEIDQARVIGDRDRLKQVILNLVTNAIKYTPPGGRVTLGLARVQHWARLTVSDTGIGLPAEELPRIFDRFYRVDKARSRAQGGAGLGLSIAQRIVQMHGGRIEAASEGPNKGATFSVWLPLDSEAKAKPAVSEAEATQPVKRSRLPQLLRR
ncbi:MAG: ATP-binding protein [Anaerolineales bacterium]|nr:ATP-binding protein [Anaerolineales bacterium]